MSTSEILFPGAAPRSPQQPRRSRFAGERLGAWLFAASFSIGMWGLALKILTPTHAPTVAPAHRLDDALAPAAFPVIALGSDAAQSLAAYPATDVGAVTPLVAPDEPGQPHD